MKDMNRKAFLKGAAAALATAAVTGTAFAEENTAGKSTAEVDFAQLASIISELEAKDAIQEVMADYWWYMDTKQRDKWLDVFTEDFCFYNNGELFADSRESFVDKNLNEAIAGFYTAHQGHQSKIVLTSPDAAIGRFVLNDVLSDTQSKAVMIEGRGYYLGEYRKCEDGKWRIAKLELGYFRMDYAGNPVVCTNAPFYENELC